MDAGSHAWHSAAVPVARRAVVLFVPQPVAGLIDDIRQRWDPVMLGRIDAHVTLVHDIVLDAVDVDAAEPLVQEVAAEIGPFDVTLTTARCWTRAANGVYLDVDDPTGAIEALHDRLSALESPAWARAGFRPHATLVHGRTVDPDLSEPAWAALCDAPFGWTVRLGTLDVIELDQATGWSSVLQVPLGPRRTVAPWQAPTITSASAPTMSPTAPASSCSAVIPPARS
jgi:2'-5' RNA ligase